MAVYALSPRKEFALSVHCPDPPTLLIQAKWYSYHIYVVAWKLGRSRAQQLRRRAVMYPSEPFLKSKSGIQSQGSKRRRTLELWGFQSGSVWMTSSSYGEGALAWVCTPLHFTKQRGIASEHIAFCGPYTRRSHANDNTSKLHYHYSYLYAAFSGTCKC